ncbi:dockerin type I domain-containing protein [Aeoliella sp. SH292]|uniref:dockerin type I domain-containing protein n=1 Tax=Aeoliella sp. SH292 TaxID=3454464 RepID=UPI003F9B3233
MQAVSKWHLGALLGLGMVASGMTQAAVLGVESAVINLNNNGGTLSAVTIGGELLADMTFATSGTVQLSASATNLDRTFWNNDGGTNPITDTASLSGPVATTGLLNSSATFLFGQNLTLTDRLVFLEAESGTNQSENAVFFPVDSTGTKIGNYSLTLTEGTGNKSGVYGPTLIPGGFTLAAEDLASPATGFNLRGVSFTLADMAGDFGDLTQTRGFAVEDPFGTLDIDPALAAIASFLPPSADFNNDSVINAADLTILAGNYQKSGITRAGGDANGDGRVDYVDYLTWRKSALNDPATLASVLAGQTVPEPSTIAALAIGLALFGARRVLSRG